MTSQGNAPPTMGAATKAEPSGTLGAIALVVGIVALALGAYVAFGPGYRYLLAYETAMHPSATLDSAERSLAFARMRDMRPEAQQLMMAAAPAALLALVLSIAAVVRRKRGLEWVGLIAAVCAIGAVAYSEVTQHIF